MINSPASRDSGYFTCQKEFLFISFACPKEMNQRKGQPQIFFGINILSAAHAIQLVGLLTSFGALLKQYCLLMPCASQPTKCHSISKKDLVALLALRRSGLVPTNNFH
jgi:hypothetical protein